jgi:hypothetical protein
LLAFSVLIAIVAAIAWRAERLSWAQVGFGQMSWATPLRATVLTLFCVAVLGPVAVWMLNELGLQPFDVARLPQPSHSTCLELLVHSGTYLAGEPVKDGRLRTSDSTA